MFKIKISQKTEAEEEYGWFDERQGPGRLQPPETIRQEETLESLSLVSPTLYLQHVDLLHSKLFY